MGQWLTRFYFFSEISTRNSKEWSHALSAIPLCIPSPLVCRIWYARPAQTSSTRSACTHGSGAQASQSVSSASNRSFNFYLSIAAYAYSSVSALYNEIYYLSIFKHCYIWLIKHSCTVIEINYQICSVAQLVRWPGVSRVVAGKSSSLRKPHTNSHLTTSMRCATSGSSLSVVLMMLNISKPTSASIRTSVDSSSGGISDCIFSTKLESL